MTNREFQSWFAELDRLTRAQREEASRRLSDLAREQPIQEEKSQTENSPKLELDSRSDTTIELRWNKRYEAVKPQLVERLRAVLVLSHPGDVERAKKTIAAVENLPFVGEEGGILRIVLYVAEDLGDSDFVYWLKVSNEGFELSSFEKMDIGGGQIDFAHDRQFVNCRPVEEEDIYDEDDEAIDMMRKSAVEFFGNRMSDEAWRMQVNAAWDDHLMPNGIRKWLESIPIGADGDSRDSIGIQWLPLTWS